MKNKTMTGNIMLLLTAAIWGSAFVAQKTGMDHIGPLAFTAARCLCGGLVLLPVIRMFDGMKKKRLSAEASQEQAILPHGKKQETRRLLKAGTFCGILIFLLMILQQIGLQNVSVGKAGFITSLYILIVPLLGLLRKQRPEGKIWISIAIALAGLYLLCVKGGIGSVQSGDFIILVATFFCALHIIVVDSYASKVDCLKLSCLQFFVSGGLASLAAILYETVAVEMLVQAAVPILYTGIISCGLAYTLQILAQKKTDPVITSLILSLESVFSAFAAFLVLGETMSAREYIGCGLVFAAIILAQLPGKSRKTPQSKKCTNAASPALPPQAAQA